MNKVTELSRLHTAGHLIGLAIKHLGLPLMSRQSHHLPGESYVECKGDIDENRKEEIKTAIEEEVNKLIAENKPIIERVQLVEMCPSIPYQVPNDKPMRVVIVEGEAGIPCGESHVCVTSQIGRVIINEISTKNGNVRICYSLN
jgi:Ser-tRNA(Ala) deacylase AlaX